MQGYINNHVLFLILAKLSEIRTLDKHTFSYQTLAQQDKPRQEEQVWLMVRSSRETPPSAIIDNLWTWSDPWSGISDSTIIQIFKEDLKTFDVKLDSRRTIIGNLRALDEDHRRKYISQVDIYHKKEYFWSETDDQCNLIKRWRTLKINFEANEDDYLC